MWRMIQYKMIVSGNIASMVKAVAAERRAAHESTT
jgi:hypothetical protein